MKKGGRFEVRVERRERRVGGKGWGSRLKLKFVEMDRGVTEEKRKADPSRAKKAHARDGMAERLNVKPSLYKETDSKRRYQSEEKVHDEILDVGKDLAEDEEADEKSGDGETVAAKPIEIFLGARFAHKKHDGCAAIERRNGEKIKGTEEKI